MGKTHSAISSSEREQVLRAARNIKRVGRRGWGRVTCPLCVFRRGSPDHRQSLGINMVTGRIRCFRCKAWGTLNPGNVEGTPSKEDIPDSDAPEHGPPEDFCPIWKDPGLSSTLLKPARDYMARRGVPSQTIAEAEIGACLKGPQGGRIVVPIINLAGEWIGWQARLWDEPKPDPQPDDPFADYVPVAARRRRWEPPKYITAEGMDREANVFNPMALEVETDEPVLVVEGTFDALPYWPDVTALLGKPSEGQIDLLKRAPRPVVVVLDGDAWIEGEMLAMRLELEGARSGWVKLPPKKDPNDFDPSKVWQAAKRAVGQ